MIIIITMKEYINPKRIAGDARIIFVGGQTNHDKSTHDMDDGSAAIKVSYDNGRRIHENSAI